MTPLEKTEMELLRIDLTYSVYLNIALGLAMIVVVACEIIALVR